MKILHVTPAYKPAWRFGGPVLSVSAVAEGLARRGHENIVVTTNSNLDEDLDVQLDTPLDVEGVRVWYFARSQLVRRCLPRLSYVSRAVGFMYSTALARTVRELVSTVDVVHTHLPFNFPTYTAARSAFAAGKPLFYHQRGVLDPQRLNFRSLKKRIYLQAIERPILQRATTLIALTQAEVESYRQFAPNTPYRVIPNGIDSAAYLPKDSGPLEHLGVLPNDLVVLFLGRLHPIKGADLLLEAFCRIADQVPRARLVLAGPDEFGIQSDFHRKAAGLSPGRVLFPGMVHGAHKKELLARADLFSLPSQAEGFSMAVLEAMASSTAVLLSTGCHFGAVEQARAGKVVNASVDELATALVRMLRDPQGLVEMGQRARILAEKHYSWDMILDAMLDAYGEGIDRHEFAHRGMG